MSEIVLASELEEGQLFVREGGRLWPRILCQVTLARRYIAGCAYTIVDYEQIVPDGAALTGVMEFRDNQMVERVVPIDGEGADAVKDIAEFISGTEGAHVTLWYALGRFWW